MNKHCLLLLIAFASFAMIGSVAKAEVFEINGVNLHYSVQGEGPELLLLHGYGSSGNDNWGKLLPELSRSFKVILPDLRGHGKSTFNEERFTHRLAAHDMLALLDHLNIERVRGIGNSTGAMTLLHMATLQPSRIESMVLHAGTSHFPESARNIMRSVQLNGISDFGDYFGDERMRRVHFLGKLQWEWIRKNFNGMKDSYRDMNFSAPLLGTITARTLIVHGDSDEFFPVDIPVSMYKSISGSSLWIIPGQGHNGAFDPDRHGMILAGLPFIPECVAHLRSSAAKNDRTKR
ncbi:MAG: alpha/beta hydrolase [Planctomycetota bacterium]